MATSSESFLLVAAIDFGTTFSGYAFSFKSSADDPERHEKIRTNKNWGASIGFQSHKTPTSVLTDKAGNFLAFGHDAEQMYSQALEGSDDDSDEGEPKDPDMLLFRHFKMMLHKQEDVKLKAVISAVDGTIRPALDIFAHAIRYLKDHLISAIQLETGTIPSADEILWVITVPAIWSETAKQFMREAAHKAKCISSKDSKRLVIALEPEAASLCCRKLNMANYADPTGVSFPTGTKYLILDCGGGTVDITAHVMEFDKTVKELNCASGGAWGGTKVDQKFTELMERALGKNFLNTYRQKHPHEWLQFLTNFEKIKKGFKPDGTSKICIPLPWSMGNLYPTMNRGKKIEKALKSIDGMSFASGMIAIKYQTAAALFTQVVEDIVEHVKQLKRDAKLKDLKYIFMVGGFSECEFLQNAVKLAFERNGVRVLIPGEAQLAIIKGAVLFGHSPGEISERILGKTFGCAVIPRYDSRVHDVSRKFTSGDGVERVDDIFETIVNSGTSVKTGKSIEKRMSKPSHAATITFQIYITDIIPSGARYVDENDFKKVGQIKITNLKVGKVTRLILVLNFGATEIQVTGRDEETGQEATTEIDFLS